MADTTERVFTRERDGRRITRVANTPAMAVKFTFDGWTELTGAEAAKVLAVAAQDAAAAGSDQAATESKPAATPAKK